MKVGGLSAAWESASAAGRLDVVFVFIYNNHMFIIHVT